MGRGVGGGVGADSDSAPTDSRPGTRHQSGNSTLPTLLGGAAAAAGAASDAGAASAAALPAAGNALVAAAAAGESISVCQKRTETTTALIKTDVSCGLGIVVKLKYFGQSQSLMSLELVRFNAIDFECWDRNGGTIVELNSISGGRRAAQVAPASPAAASVASRRSANVRTRPAPSARRPNPRSVVHFQFKPGKTL